MSGPAEAHLYVYVCETCVRGLAIGAEEKTRGRQLADALVEKLRVFAPGAHIVHRIVLCLNGCPSPCNVALRAPGKWSLRLGRLTPADAEPIVRQCVKFGVEFIFHASFASDATIEQLEKVKHKHWIAPAIAARYQTTYEAGDFGISTEVAELIGNKRELEAGIATMTKMHKAGIRVLPFGDYGFAWIPHGTDTRDFEHFVNLFGFEPWEVLRAATAYGGEAFGGDKLGQIRPGFLADVLLIDGDPLQDLTLFQDRRNILAIMKDGQFHKSFQVRAAQRVAAAE